MSSCIGLFGSFFDLLFFAVTELIDGFDRLLFEFARILSLFLVIFNVLGSRLLSKHHLITVRLEQHVKVALEIKPSFLGPRVHLRKHMRINVLEDIFGSLAADEGSACSD